jgi:hypothetical protein
MTNRPMIDVRSTVTVEISNRATVRAKYLGPTNHRGSRIVVSRFDSPSYGTDPNRITVSWDYSLGVVENYAAAIKTYLERADWQGKWIVSYTDSGAVAVQPPTV